MVEALIIDACRTPRGIGKAGKGALSDIHPQHLGATVLSALRERTGIDTAEVDDIIWGTSAQVGEQTGDIGRMSALDAGYDVRASGVTLDRFCGSGITSVNMAAASIMSGAEDLVIAGGTEKNVDGDAARRRPVDDGLRQSAAPCQTSAVAPGRLRRRNRDT
jgi:acetyl-CoA C-acetyltransferase